MTIKNHYVDIGGGADVFCTEQGCGMPIVFIPGWTFTTEVFARQLAHFGGGHRAVSYDPRSHGRSTVCLHGNDYATHGADLARVMAALGLRDVVLVGWSFGCLTLWEYVKQAGLDNVRGVVCVDSSPKCLSADSGDWVEGPLDEVAGAYNAFLTSAKGQRDFIEYYATNVMVQRELQPEELQWIVEQSQKTPHYIAANLFASGVFSDYREQARQVDQGVPSRYIVAEHWADTAVAFNGKLLPNTKTEVLGGHMMFWEHADQFNALVDEFLAGL